jgi:hypothetical protein
MRPATTKIQAPDGQPVEYPARLLTVAQLEQAQPALKGRVRGFVLRADLNIPDYAGLRDAIVRLGPSVYIDEPRFNSWLNTRRGTAPNGPRNPHGRAGKKGAAP